MMTPAPSGEVPRWLAVLDARSGRLRAFHQKLLVAGLSGTYEAAHAQLALDAVQIIHERREWLATGRLAPLPAPSQAEGLEAAIKSDEGSADLSGGKSFDFIPKTSIVNLAVAPVSPPAFFPVLCQR